MQNTATNEIFLSVHKLHSNCLLHFYKELIRNFNFCRFKSFYVQFINHQTTISFLNVLRTELYTSKIYSE